MLRFTLRRDGVVLNPEVIEVTGHDSFREAALQALAGVGQLPRFPDEIRRRELLVEVPINYRIVERSSSGKAAPKAVADDDAIEKYRNYTPEQLGELPQETISSEVPIMYTMAARRALSLGGELSWYSGWNSTR